MLKALSLQFPDFQNLINLNESAPFKRTSKELFTKLGREQERNSRGGKRIILLSLWLLHIYCAPVNGYKEYKKTLFSAIAPHFGATLWFLSFLLLMVSLSFLRLWFVLRHFNYAKSVPAKLLAISFVRGLNIDLMTTGFIMLLFLPLVFLVKSPQKLTKWIITGIYGFIYSIIFMLGASSAEYFAYFDSHFSIWALEYLTDPQIVFYMITKEFNPFILIILIMSIIAFSVMLFSFVLRRTMKLYGKKKATVYRVIIFSIIAIMLSIVSARGSLGLAPGDWGIAIFSNNHFANQTALNGIYTLFKTVQEFTNNDGK